MAKKKAKKAAVKKAGKKKGTNTGLIAAIVAVVILIVVALELFIVIKKQQVMNKKPVLLAQWKPQYKGQTGIPVGPEHLFVIDNQAMQVKKYKKLTGEEVDTIQLDKEPKWAVETSGLETLVLTNEAVSLKRYKGKKLVGEIKLEGIKTPVNMVLDSKDNLYVSDSSTSKITKFTLDGEKLAEIGGRSASKSGFVSPVGKIFIDAADNLYAIEPGVKKVKVFDPEGKFLREWVIQLLGVDWRVSLAPMNDGTVYLNDLYKNQIQVYSKNGKLIGKFDSDFGGTFSIGSPGSISGGTDNRLYVCTHDMGIFEPVIYEE